jgi:histidinol-phosphatase (PHP family)
MYIINRDGLSNLHTHTTYCDGSDTPEELIQQALKLGFSEIGFSGHSFTPFDTSYCMSREKTEAYRADILDKKEKYKGKIDVKLGLELDHYGEGRREDYDFLIGSNHYLKLDDGYYPVDENEEITLDTVNRKFGGSFEEYYECYYEQEAEVIKDTGADIVGHFDIITKFNEGSRFFDENSERYLRAALDAVDKIASSDPFRKPVFEITTGAMAKGYRTRPYPAMNILSEIDRMGCPVIITSDCHDKSQLNYGFDSVLATLSQW